MWRRTDVEKSSYASPHVNVCQMRPTELLRQVLPFFYSARCSPVGGAWERVRRATVFASSPPFHTLTPLPGLNSRSGKATCSQLACRLQPRPRTSIRQPMLRVYVGREIDSINLQVGENKQDESVGRRKAMRGRDWRGLSSAGRQRFTVKSAVHQQRNTDFWDTKLKKWCDSERTMECAR